MGEYIQFIPNAVLVIIQIIIIFLCIRKKDKAKTDEEKQQLDEIIKTVLTDAVTNIKTLCNNNNIKYNKKEVKKIANTTIKKESE